MPRDGGNSASALARFVQFGFGMGALAKQLQQEGAKSLVASWHWLLERIAEKSAALIFE